MYIVCSLHAFKPCLFSVYNLTFAVLGAFAVLAVVSSTVQGWRNQLDVIMQRVRVSHAFLSLTHKYAQFADIYT